MGENTPLLAVWSEASGKSGLLARAKERSREHDCLGIKPLHQQDRQQGLKVAQLSAEAAAGSNELVRASRWGCCCQRTGESGSSQGQLALSNLCANMQCSHVACASLLRQTRPRPGLARALMPQSRCQRNQVLHQRLRGLLDRHPNLSEVDFHKFKSTNAKTEIVDTLLAECSHCVRNVGVPADAGGSDT